MEYDFFFRPVIDTYCGASQPLPYLLQQDEPEQKQETKNKEEES
jgi:hypothetical protein